MLLSNLYQKLFTSQSFLNSQFQFQHKLLQKINTQCPNYKENKEQYYQCVNKYKSIKSQYTNYIQLMVQQRQNNLNTVFQQKCFKQTSVDKVKQCMKEQSRKFTKMVEEKDINYITELRKLEMNSIK